MFHFQTTVASHCFISVLSLSLSSMYWETATQQREAKTQCPRWHIRGGGIWEAEASVALKWERTSLISNLKLPCSHLWPALNSLTQAIHRLFSHKNKCVYTTSCINTHTHTHTETKAIWRDNGKINITIFTILNKRDLDVFFIPLHLFDQCMMCYWLRSVNRHYKCQTAIYILCPLGKPLSPWLQDRVDLLKS